MNKNSQGNRAEYDGKSWSFVGRTNPEIRVRFEQAVMYATWVGENAVEGIVKSVHGVDMSVLKLLDPKPGLVREMGINALPCFEDCRKHLAVRLMPDGTVERNCL